MSTPMTASELVAALKAEGVKVVEHSGWSTHERDGATGKTFGPVHGVVIHHTASADGTGILEYVWSGTSSLPGPLCHGLIHKDGTVVLISKGRANHAGGGDSNVLHEVINESYGDHPSAPHRHEGSAGAVDGNDVFYGFECVNEGDGKDPWPDAQVDAMIRASAAICRHYGWTAKSVIGHKEWSDWKSDPKGIDMKVFRSKVADRLDGGTHTDGGSKPLPAPKPRPVYATFPGSNFFHIGKTSKLVTELGKALVRAGWKGYKFGPGPVFTFTDKKAVAWFQRKQGWTGADADGYPGPETWKRLKVRKPS